MRAQYVVQEIGQNLRRNLTMVIAVVVSTAVALVMLGSGLLMRQQTKAMQDYWYGKVQVNVFRSYQADVGTYPTSQTTVAPLAQAKIKASSAKLAGIKEIQFESQDQAYQRDKAMNSGSQLV